MPNFDKNLDSSLSIIGGKVSSTRLIYPVRSTSERSQQKGFDRFSRSLLRGIIVVIKVAIMAAQNTDLKAPQIFFLYTYGH